MDETDLRIRNATYHRFVALGRAPTPTEVATELAAETGAAAGDHGGTDVDIAEAWRRLHEEHALVLDADGALRMLNPFALQPTPFPVEAAGRSWYGNCGWDAFGIGAALGVDSVIHATCPDCADPLTIHVRDRRPIETDAVFHVLVPAARWWSDIGFT